MLFSLLSGGATTNADYREHKRREKPSSAELEDIYHPENFKRSLSYGLN